METLAQPSTTALPARPAKAVPRAGFGLSWRLLVLTIGFVMLAEVLILVPSLARFRVDYLQEKIGSAHLVMTALEASPGRIDAALRDRLLAQAGMLGMTVLRPNMPPRTLGPRVPPRIPKVYDLRGAMVWTLILDTAVTMADRTPEVMAVTGLSPFDTRVVVDVVMDEGPLCEALWEYFRRILVLSIFISFMTAALVYATIQWLAVRPLRRLTAHITAFQEDPEDPRRVITPSNRADEVGTAELALADMQKQIRASLLEQERLAGVGAAVTKISHDLKNILATAMLESDRLEAAATVDPEIKHITGGIVRAIDRAVKLSNNTLRFAKEGLPSVRKQPLDLRTMIDDVVGSLKAVFPALAIAVEAPAGRTIVADQELLQRALENLIRNAGEAGATRVTLTLERDGEYDCLVIADNGPGLPKKALDNLFVAFTGSARAGGSGLGLPIAREGLRVQGGEIVLRESGSTGTVFAMRLPLSSST
ncbi:MAG: HAMP domain-containing sensor histidine kinase [Rhodospirillaceae bacterium]|nr:HAMP domain-containing sensor histidine kinase [Rhodospirillaceae bacterium]